VPSSSALARSLPILPRGGGTSLAGQCTNRAVVIDLSPNCRAMLGLDAPTRRVRCRAGHHRRRPEWRIADRRAVLRSRSGDERHANIGGCIGNNAAGARSIRYGRTSENLVAVDVALLGTGSVSRSNEGSGRNRPAGSRGRDRSRAAAIVALPRRR
jgi:FAD/FMN-containing dehydrogenase